MMDISKLLLLMLVVAIPLVHGLFWGSSKSKQEETKQKDFVVKNTRAPFEMKTMDEKFVASAQQYLSELSELDVCHHKVVAKLRSSCHEIAEEDLAKLSVSLLNCQSEAEGRPTYTCTEDMSLAECTSAMDGTTWNAYHIMSNRAKAVCYSVRQQQFQYKTEYTVNQLASTAEGQLHVLKHLQDSHEDLQESTETVVRTMTIGQQELVVKQQRLKMTQFQMQSNIMENLKALTQEKALMAAGHHEFAQRIEYLKTLLAENTSTQLMAHGMDARTNHQQLLDDLSHIGDKAVEIWHKINGSTQQMMDNQLDTVQHHESMLANLKKMNETANHIVEFLSKMQTGIDKKLGWISTMVGGTGDQLSMVMTCVCHILYFIMTCILVTFLQTPMLSRFVLLVLVPLNAVSEIKHKKSLDFASLSWFLGLTIMANWFYIFVYSIIQQRYKSRNSEQNRYKTSQQISEDLLSTSCGGSSLALTESEKKLTAVVKEAVSQEVKKLINGMALQFSLLTTVLGFVLDGWSLDNHLCRESITQSEATPSEITRISSSCQDDTSSMNVLHLPSLNTTLNDRSTVHYTHDNSDHDNSYHVSNTVVCPTVSPINSSILTPHSVTTTPMPAVHVQDNDALGTVPSPSPSPSLDLVKKQLDKMMDVAMDTPARLRRSSISSVSTNISVSSTGTPRRPCHGITKTGLRCKRSAVRGKDYCSTHQS
ncbi:protein brambleberry-like [Glandiceps talaboti]